MKKNRFLTIVIVTNIGFILLQIHKHNKVTELLYEKQRLEQQLETINKESNELKQELCALQDRQNVKKYAQKNLQMSAIRLAQMKKITDSNES